MATMRYAQQWVAVLAAVGFSAMSCSPDPISGGQDVPAADGRVADGAADAGAHDMTP